MYKVFDYLIHKKQVKQYLFLSATSQYLTRKPSNILKWDGVHFHSLSGPNQTLRMDFPVSQVYIEKLKILTSINRDPTHWVFEGSEDGISFITLVDNTDGKPMCEWVTNGSLLICNNNIENEFNVTTPGYYTSLRMRQTGLDSSGSQYLIVAAIEIIGKIRLAISRCSNEIPKINLFSLVSIILI